MAKISIAQWTGSKPEDAVVSETEAAIFPLINVKTSALAASYHIVEPGKRIRWKDSDADVCAFILEGSVELNDAPLGEGDVFIVEHGATAELSCTADARIAVLESREVGEKSGGCVHLIRREDVPNNDGTDHGELASSFLYADASCPTCDVWLHGNIFPEGNSVGLHSHSEDEIVIVTGGEIILGPRRYGADTAVFIAKDTIYGFQAGRGGMSFINFRVGCSRTKQAKGTDLLDEAEYFRTRLGSPKHEYLPSTSLPA